MAIPLPSLARAEAPSICQSLVCRAFATASPAKKVDDPELAKMEEASSERAARLLDLGDDQEDRHDEKTALAWAVLRSAFGWRPRGQGIGKAIEAPAGNRAFDIADSVEAGLARESTTDFTTPLRKSGKLWRFRVLRSEDRLQSRLVTESGEFLLFSQISMEARRVSFFPYDPAKREERDLYDPTCPAFTMTFSEDRTQWTLVQERCQNCQMLPQHFSCAGRGKQQLAFIQHYRRQVGDGISNVMEVKIPGIYTDGQAMIWCPNLGRGDLAQSSGHGYETQRLITKMPVWNEEVESLVLDFKGRNIVSSAKNFQLALSQKPEHVLCQYGKLSNSNLALDFKFPISVVQAFGIALSTSFWI
mmetsp:Transcript_123556/g.357289  ORF Transcript_123556/g.357289 Transcript_123556/m.357289 type:complete len:360 (+) Transcript_123556:96-1175(+)